MEWFSSLQLARGANRYSLYVLALLLFAYLLNQLDRYALAIVTKPASQVLLNMFYDTHIFSFYGHVLSQSSP